MAKLVNTLMHHGFYTLDVLFCEKRVDVAPAIAVMKMVNRGDGRPGDGKGVDGDGVFFYFVRGAVYGVVVLRVADVHFSRVDANNGAFEDEISHYIEVFIVDNEW